MDPIALSSSLRTAVSGLHKGLRKQATAVQSYSMTELETIGLLTRHPSLLPTELAAYTRVKTQSMSQILKKLEGQGVIKRTYSKEDKRKVYISLTASGKKLVEKTKYDKDEWLSRLIQESLSARERELLIRSLPVLHKLAAWPSTS
jgi:DNA-binding MarR family transcriptional regulator